MNTNSVYVPFFGPWTSVVLSIIITCFILYYSRKNPAGEVQHAITNGNDEDLRGHEITIRNGKVAICPGFPECRHTEIPTIEVGIGGIVTVGYHGDHDGLCPFSGEILKILSHKRVSKMEVLL